LSSGSKWTLGIVKLFLKTVKEWQISRLKKSHVVGSSLVLSRNARSIERASVPWSIAAKLSQDRLQMSKL